ncbi:DAPG hydrolase family protein [Rahnella sp. Larv3_ips]|uniref:DAPG hydrolase family protein n=1 Tax=Rahnella sp. Larv3_ips TaxID=1896943 RepID=UPI001F11E556|nr:hypothetical protein [Rahnella sp. Larv3_ips]
MATPACDYGASIRAVESLAEIPPIPACLKFHNPASIFGEKTLEKAMADDCVSAIVAARIGFGEEVGLDSQGDPLDGQMLHIARDTPFGCVLRSRFILGMSNDDSGHPTDEMGLALIRHCYTEFTFLSRFLPSLYYGEKANDEEIALPL